MSAHFRSRIAVLCVLCVLCGKKNEAQSHSDAKPTRKDGKPEFTRCRPEHKKRRAKHLASLSHNGRISQTSPLDQDPGDQAECIPCSGAISPCCASIHDR